MSHYLRNDRRINVVRNIINPFINQLEDIRDLCKEGGSIFWDLYEDESEHLIGTALIVFQNYINSSISDLYPNLSKLHSKYTLDKMMNNSSKTTRIKLIIELANYYKHRDLPTELHKHTTSPLDDLKLDYKEIYNLENDEYFYKMGSGSPIFNGLTLLSERWDLNDLITIVSEWRENLWNREYPCE